MESRDLVWWNSFVARYTRCVATVIVGVLSMAVAMAQPVAIGSIQGRVSNPASGEYVRNTQVRLPGSENVAVSPRAALNSTGTGFCST